MPFLNENLQQIAISNCDHKIGVPFQWKVDNTKNFIQITIRYT